MKSKKFIEPVSAVIARVNADSAKQEERMQQIARASSCKIDHDDSVEDDSMTIAPHQLRTMLSAAYQSGREHERVQPLAQVVTPRRLR